MNRLVQFYFRETKGFIILLTGFYILFNIMSVISRRAHGLPAIGIMILSIILVIFIIKFNLYDTGKETFTLVSMTDSTPEKILLSKLIVSYILVLIVVIVEYVFFLVYKMTVVNYFVLSWESMLMFPVKILFFTTLAVSYISYFMIWIKSFSISRVWRKIITAGAVIGWFVINGMIRHNVLIFSTDTVHRGRHFGGDRLGLWSIIWHLSFCITFFLITVYLQRRKIDQI
ncbi:hypothetical protein [Sebaldella termitidis]|uniref:hypothetical protein n=1 Tax=Sebaldella termitidis TaxID=826 RepID=UPI003EB8B503